MNERHGTGPEPHSDGERSLFPDPESAVLIATGKVHAVLMAANHPTATNLREAVEALAAIDAYALAIRKLKAVTNA